MSPSDVVRFACPSCRAVLGVRPAHGGRQFRCPKCGTAVTAPTARPMVRQAAATGPPATERAAAETADEVPVVCPVCETRMYAPARRAGSRIRCPDCHTAVTVRLPASPPAPRPQPRWTDEDEQLYRLRSDSSQPAAGPPLVAVICRLCGTRMHAPVQQVGQSLVCPDCGVATVIAAPAETGHPGPPPRRKEQSERQEEDLQLAPASSPVVFDSHAQDLLHEAEERIRELEQSDRKSAQHPDQLVSSGGVFSFPFRRSMILFWVGMSCGIWLVVLLLLMAFDSGDPRIMFASLLMLVVGAGSLIGFIATHLVSIVYNTSEGFDEIVHWPENHLIEWFMDFMYFATSAAFSILPWVTLDKLDVSPLLRNLIGIPFFFLIYPVLLLSLMESGSRWIPFSDVVLSTLRSDWKQWMRFYGRALALVALCLLVGGLDVLVPGGWGLRLSLVALLSAVVSACLIIYCRALGKLVLACDLPPAPETDGASVGEATEPEMDHVQGLT